MKEREKGRDRERLKERGRERKRGSIVSLWTCVWTLILFDCVEFNVYYSFVFFSYIYN